MSKLPPMVLLVEDDPNAALLVQRSFGRRQPPVMLCHVSDADEAAAFLLGQPPYDEAARLLPPVLILLDLKLPGRSGLEFLQWLRAHPRLGRQPVVVFSCSDDPRDLAQSYDLGANSYIIKPPNLERFHQVLNCTLDYWLLHVMRPQES